MKRLSLLIIILLISISCFGKTYNSTLKKVIYEDNGFYNIKWFDENNCSNYYVTLEEIYYDKNEKIIESEPIYSENLDKAKISISSEKLVPGGEYYLRVIGKKGDQEINVYEKNIILDSYPNITLPKSSLYTLKNKKNTTYREKFRLNPSMFFFDSSEYSKDLALMSAYASSCAYFSDVKDIKGRLEEFFAKSGFEDVVYFNEDGLIIEKENSDRVFYGIGRKKINIKHKTYNLIGIVIRGTVAGEWFSNFNIGEENYHKGFRICSEDVEKNLEAYLNKYNLLDSEYNKIWITGHSRGGSVANILSYKLKGKPYIKDNNIYTYTFASTQVVKELEGSSNCVNFVNKGDFVPCIPYWSKWTKYGYEINEDKLSHDSMEKIKIDFRNITGYVYEGYSLKQMNLIISELYKIAPSEYSFYNVKFNKSAKDGGRTAYDTCNIIGNIAATGKPKGLKLIPNEFNKVIGMLAISNAGTPKIMNAHSMEFYTMFVYEYNKNVKDFNIELDLDR